MRFTRILLLCSLVALVAVPAALAIRFTDDSYFMPTGVVGQPYSKQFNGAGGCGPALPYQYTLIAGSLPPGLSLSFSGLIGGTPTQAGSWSFYVNLSDQNPPSASWCRPAEAQRQFTITVINGAQPLTINQPTLPTKATVVGTAYSFQFTAQGGGTQTWSLQSGSLPAGMTLNSSGLLSGTPTAVGDFTFVVKVSDGSRSATQTYTLSVVNPLEVTARVVPAAEVSRVFRLQLSATGGRPSYAWALAPGVTLPAGLALDPASGVVSGVPAVEGTFPVKVTVTDTFGFATTVDLQLKVAAKLALGPTTVAVAKVGHRVRARLLANGGVLPRTWKIVRGTLPAGVRLGARTGQLLGSAQKPGTSRIVVQVKDALGAIARTTLVLRVRG
jgi:large repetitive protein